MRLKLISQTKLELTDTRKIFFRLMVKMISKSSDLTQDQLDSGLLKPYFLKIDLTKISFSSDSINFGSENNFSFRLEKKFRNFKYLKLTLKLI